MPPVPTAQGPEQIARAGVRRRHKLIEMLCCCPPLVCLPHRTQGEAGPAGRRQLEAPSKGTGGGLSCYLASGHCGARRLLPEESTMGLRGARMVHRGNRSLPGSLSRPVARPGPELSLERALAPRAKKPPPTPPTPPCPLVLKRPEPGPGVPSPASESRPVRSPKTRVRCGWIYRPSGPSGTP